MNKEDILKRSRQQQHQEYNHFLTFKTIPFLMGTFTFLCICMMTLSFFSPFSDEIFLTSSTLLLTFLIVYSFAYFYYMRFYRYLILALLLLCLFFYSISRLWIFMW